MNVSFFGNQELRATINTEQKRIKAKLSFVTSKCYTEWTNGSSGNAESWIYGTFEQTVPMN